MAKACTDERETKISQTVGPVGGAPYHKNCSLDLAVGNVAGQDNVSTGRTFPMRAAAICWLAVWLAATAAPAAPPQPAPMAKPAARNVPGAASNIPAKLSATKPTRHVAAEDAETATAQSSIGDEVRRQIKLLDSVSYRIRSQAAERLGVLAATVHLTAQVNDEVQKIVDAGRQSAEVLAQLEELGFNTKPSDRQLEALGETEIRTLIEQLDADVADTRLAAQRHLCSLAKLPQTSVLLMAELKRRRLAGPLSVEMESQVLPLIKEVRLTWATADPKEWTPAKISDEQLKDWIADLAAPRDTLLANGQSRWLMAQQELSDVLLRDENIARVAALLKSTMDSETQTADVQARFRTLYNLTQPAMVAEIWLRDEKGDVRHKTVQHLLVDVPSFGPGAMRASHFDRIDDTTAHCVSGNTLLPGDYPVGAAFPPPGRSESMFFHLVNLPTPRRRLVYETHLERPESERRAEITRRTLAAVLAANRRLDEREIRMLDELDAVEISRFAGPYLKAQKDGNSGLFRDASLPVGSLSDHAAFCLMLAYSGTEEALPGLIDAIEAGSVDPPRDEAPCNMPALAAIAIAARSTSPESEKQLARLISRSEPLLLDSPPMADVGASAAAVLVRRQSIAPEQFRLRRVEERFLLGLGATGYSFTDPAGRDAVLAWWKRKSG